MVKKKHAGLLVIAWSIIFLFAANVKAETVFSTTFNKNGWNAGEWILAKEPELSHFGGWIQREDSIENETPSDKPGTTALEETFTSMVYKKKVGGDIKESSTVEYYGNSGPGIVFVSEMGKDKEGRPEYRESFEIYIYDGGVNIWQHVFKNGKWSYIKTASANFTLKPNTRYKFEVEKKGKYFSVAIDGHRFGYLETSLPEEFYAGIAGCEGITRFYDFKIEK